MVMKNYSGGSLCHKKAIRNKISKMLIEEYEYALVLNKMLKEFRNN